MKSLKEKRGIEGTGWVKKREKGGTQAKSFNLKAAGWEESKGGRPKKKKTKNPWA